jgi:hypothetical protein
MWVTIDLKLTLGALTLRLNRPVAADLTRARAKQLRTAYRIFGDRFSEVTLVPDDAELRALVALRCVQQGYREAA